MNLKPRVLTGLLWLSTSVRAMKEQNKQSLSSVGGLLLLLSRLSHVRLCATPETAAHQAPPSLGFSRQEHWSGLPFPSPGDLLDPGIKSGSTTVQVDALLSELVKNLPAMRETWV